MGSVQETGFNASYDSANRLAQVTLNNDTFTLGYDANGNLISKVGASGTTTYTWDSRDRLTGINGPGISASFQYDALGRRIAKTVNNQNIQYLYDGVQAIGEVTNGNISATLLTSLNLDEVLARYTTTATQSYLTDALGSVIAQANDQQGIQNFYAYTPYGEAQPLGPDDNNPIQYTGRENDGPVLSGVEGTELYYYRARYYDPVLKRFIQEDPIGLVGGLNVYAYVGGKPVNARDPLGLLNLVVGGGATATVGGAGTPVSAQYDYSGGVYYNFESGEAGAYSSVGIGAGGTSTYNDGTSGPANYGGFYGGLGLTVGVVFGGAENVAGRTQNLYIQPPGFPGVVTYYGPNNEFQGIGLTFGPGIGGGLTQTNTRTLPIRRPACTSSACCP